jgi:hypothetical protein
MYYKKRTCNHGDIHLSIENWYHNYQYITKSMREQPVLDAKLVHGHNLFELNNQIHLVTCRLSFTSLSKAGGDNLGSDDTVSDINLPMLLSGATRPS